MSQSHGGQIGFACAYTPLPLLDAAGFAPFRVLPSGDWPDQAGRLLHDNLCPHVKRILDRALQNDLPELTGMVFINSCDAMRRLADAWKVVRKGGRSVLIDLPVTDDAAAVSYFAEELRRLAATLAEWGGRSPAPEDLLAGVNRRNELARLFGVLQERQKRGALKGGAAALQKLYNFASTQSVDEALAALRKAVEEPEEAGASGPLVPVFLFGNVLPDPEALALFELCGARIAAEDLCTGSRLFKEIPCDSDDDAYTTLARGLLGRSPCARTLNPVKPVRLAEDVLTAARAGGVRGVIGYTMKFCDPYLARLPAVREVLRETGLPLLLLEGDCTLRSIGQQRTRIEAFVEMLR
ncbi:MAG: 2-hydroxyacyl-CoA dehydratase [Myxococcales bacterium]|nr:MAG: 2-hydroxyacyl-CoA dehydratase [Myxococcales bacterium]